MGQGILSLLNGKRHRLPDGKMFYDVVHTEEVEDQMTARVEKAVRARPGRIWRSRRTQYFVLLSPQQWGNAR